MEDSDNIVDDLIHTVEDLRKQNETLWKEHQNYKRKAALYETVAEQKTVVIWALVIITAGLIAGHIWRSM